MFTEKPFRTGENYSSWTTEINEPQIFTIKKYNSHRATLAVGLEKT